MDKDTLLQAHDEIRDLRSHCRNLSDRIKSVNKAAEKLVSYSAELDRKISALTEDVEATAEAAQKAILKDIKRY